MKPTELEKAHRLIGDMIKAQHEQERKIVLLEQDVRIWKGEAESRSEAMVGLNLDRAAMGVEIAQLKEALEEMLADYAPLPLDFFDDKVRNRTGKTARDRIAMARAAVAQARGIA